MSSAPAAGRLALRVGSAVVGEGDTTMVADRADRGDQGDDAATLVQITNWRRRRATAPRRSSMAVGVFALIAVSPSRRRGRAGARARADAR